MSDARDRSGNYPIESVRAEELKRLRLQDEAWAADAEVLVDRIGVAKGWRCLDLGCGPKGLTDLLSERVGASGQVVGLEYNPAFVAVARQGAAPNVEIVEGDAYATGLPGQSFDLVHMRFLASTSGGAEGLIAEAKRLLRPGGILAMQEADTRTLGCYPPHPAWTRLYKALEACFPGTMGEDPSAHQLYRIMRRAGFEDVFYRPTLLGVRSMDPWVDYLPSTIESVRTPSEERGLFGPGELDETLAACRAHLADADTVVTSLILVQVWGRTPHSR